MILKLFKKIWDKIGNCEFKKQCPYFDEKSEVCLDGGGNYCGEYRFLRKLNQQKNANRSLST